MEHNANSLVHFNVRAADGVCGKIRDVFFNTTNWKVEHLVVEFLQDRDTRNVLLPPVHCEIPDWEHQEVQVALNISQVHNCPDISSDTPLSLQPTGVFMEYCDWPNYWDFGAGVWGAGSYPGILAGSKWTSSVSRFEEPSEVVHYNPDLQSMAHVVGYNAHGLEHDQGHIDGFVLDEKEWKILFFIVNTGREVDGVSQKVLSQTLKKLERDGLIERRALPTVPVTVEYSLTALGITLAEMIEHLSRWAESNMPQILAAQARYDARATADEAALAA